MPYNSESYDDTLLRVYEHFGRENMLVPLKDVAEWLGVCWDTLRYDESFPKRKVGRLVYVNLTSLARWLS